MKVKLGDCACVAVSIASLKSPSKASTGCSFLVLHIEGMLVRFENASCVALFQAVKLMCGA